MSEALSHSQLSAIADEFGTPVYIYHAEKIAEQYQQTKKGFYRPGCRFFLCLKSADQYQCSSVYQIHWRQCRLQFNQ